MTTQTTSTPSNSKPCKVLIVNGKWIINPDEIITKSEAEKYLAEIGLRVEIPEAGVSRIDLRVEIPEAGVSRIDLFKLVQSELLAIKNHGVVAPIRMNSAPIPGKLDKSKVQY